MTLEELKKQNIRNGKFVYITYKKEFEPSKNGKGHKVVKVSTQVVRLGCFYGNIIKNDEGYQPTQEQDKRFGDFLSGLKNIVSSKDEKTYFWAYTTNNKKHKAHSKYYVDGVEMTYEQVENTGYVCKSKLKPSNKPCSMFVIKLENLIAIGR